MTELDARRLVRDGTAQDQRAPAALDPASAPVDEHGPADRIVFARAYAAFVRYFGEDDTVAGNWQPFFDRDVSAQLAVAAIADVADYGSVLKGLLTILDSRQPLVPAAEQIRAAGAMIGAIGSLAARLDLLKETLPDGHPLRAALVNLIRTRLAPALRRLIAIDKGGRGLGVVGDAVPDPPLRILGRTATTFSAVVAAGLSADWITEPGAGWAAYHAGIAADTEVYGTGDFLNHLANHYAFTAIRTVFLAGYARAASDARTALAETFQQAGHEPHYTLFLAFVRLLEEVRAETNTLTGRHLDFYYRDILRFRERPPVAGHAHLLLEPAKGVDTHLIAAGVPFRAGKDDRGRDVVFTADRDLVVNRARVADRRTVYRHHDAPGEILPFQDGRIFAAPVTEAEDGSWHPFFAKTYEDGVLTAIRMPPAELGFAVASHYLLLAEGVRVITLTIATTGGAALPDLRDDVVCRLTTAKGWLERRPSVFTREAGGPIQLRVDLTGDDPAVTGYVAATHGGSLTTTLPVLTVRLRDRAAAPTRYPLLADLVVTGIDVQVDVTGIRALALSNDLGPIDPAKAFQPYGPAPIAGNALVVGCAELAGKQLTSAGLRVTWMSTPKAHLTTPHVVIEFLTGGGWIPAAVGHAAVGATNYALVGADTGIVAPDLFGRGLGGRLSPSLLRGFARLRLDAGFGLDQYAVDLASKIKAGQDPPPIPVVPAMREIVLDYVAAEQTTTHLFHLAPFGTVEQPLPATLLPRFTDDGAEAEAELYLGIAGLRPPQNLALLVQVQDGTANPLAAKPSALLRWSYLSHDRWADLAADAVDDGTDQLLESGVLTLAVPADANSDNTVLPGGLHWVRAAVRTASDAVCRLLLVEAQGLSTTDQGFLAQPLPPGTISKPVRPDPAIKTITQPFAGFGGQGGAEAPAAFATRVSERLRHKDRAVALWDYERLVLEAFPAIYRVRCLNHTRYEPGIYRELAAGHVTVVTIPVHRDGDWRDPLRPYTSLGLLERIQEFLAARMPCFVTLHVRNPQFEEVHVDFRVRLRDGFDETFHVNLLAGEITRFLSPWGFSDQANPTFTGRYATSVLIDFIEERPYVDYVTDFRMFHHYPGTGPDGERAEVITGSRAISVLVSAPAAKHVITVIHAAEDEAPAEDCPCEVAAG